jgi:hypothetical protein
MNEGLYSAVLIRRRACRELACPEVYRWAGSICGELAEPSNGFIPRGEVSLPVGWERKH